MSIVDEQKIYDEAKTNNTTSARAQAFNANEQNLAQNGNPLAQAAQGVGWQTPPANTGGTVAEPMTAQKSVAQSANGAGQTQKANIAVDKNVKTTGNVFVKPVTAPNAPTNNGFTPGIGFHTTEIGKNGEQIIPQDQFVPDKNYDKLRVNVPTPSRALTYADFRDAMYGPEAERENRANRIAKIQAVGDALRHIGNLATTIGSGRMGRAIPQQFKTSPAQQTLAEYKAERKERDAMGYQQLMQHQKQKQQEVENEMARQKMANDWAYKQAELGFKAEDNKRKAELHPYQLKKMEGDALAALAKGEANKYDAIIKQLTAENTPKALELKNKLDAEKVKTEKARQSQAYAGARSANASADQKYAQIRQMKEGKPVHYQTNDPNYLWEVGENDVKAIGHELAGKVKKMGWARDIVDENGNLKKSASYAELIDAAYEHINDPNIQSVFNDHCVKVKSNYNPADDPLHRD